VRPEHDVKYGGEDHQSRSTHLRIKQNHQPQAGGLVIHAGGRGHDEVTVDEFVAQEIVRQRIEVGAREYA